LPRPADLCDQEFATTCQRAIGCTIKALKKSVSTRQAQRSRTFDMLDSQKLCKAATDVLVDHMGIAAGFVAEDALVGIEGKSGTQWPESILLTLYLNELQKLLPPGLDGNAIRAQVTKAYQR
jgi:hypothetical protein